jgi:hypothetical protein
MKERVVLLLSPPRNERKRLRETTIYTSRKEIPARGNEWYFYTLLSKYLPSFSII